MALPYIDGMIESFRSKSLRQFWTTGDAAKINPAWRRKVSIVLGALDIASVPSELDITGMGLHALTGDLAGRYAITVSRNWRITFGWNGENATAVDLEDYHGT
jgi:proteic killer suppression protein